MADPTKVIPPPSAGETVRVKRCRGGTPVAATALAEGFTAHAFDGAAAAIGDSVYAEVVPTRLIRDFSARGATQVPIRVLADK